jgi:hypothetical protein
MIYFKPSFDVLEALRFCSDCPDLTPAVVAEVDSCRMETTETEPTETDDPVSPEPEPIESEPPDLIDGQPPFVPLPPAPIGPEGPR